MRGHRPRCCPDLAGVRPATHITHVEPLCSLFIIPGTPLGAAPPRRRSVCFLLPGPAYRLKSEITQQPGRLNELAFSRREWGSEGLLWAAIGMHGWGIPSPPPHHHPEVPIQICSILMRRGYTGQTTQTHPNMLVNNCDLITCTKVLVGGGGQWGNSGYPLSCSLTRPTALVSAGFSETGGGVLLRFPLVQDPPPSTSLEEERTGLWGYVTVSALIHPQQLVFP